MALQEKQLRDVLDASLAHDTEALIADARNIAARLTRVADDLEARGLDAVVSSLGELQAQATMFDVRCGVWNSEREIRRALD